MKKGNRRKYIEALLNIRNPTRPKRKQGGIENSSNMKGSGATLLGGNLHLLLLAVITQKLGKVVGAVQLFNLPHFS